MHNDDLLGHLRRPRTARPTAGRARAPAWTARRAPARAKWPLARRHVRAPPSRRFMHGTHAPTAGAGAMSSNRRCSRNCAPLPSARPTSCPALGGAWTARSRDRHHPHRQGDQPQGVGGATGMARLVIEQLTPHLTGVERVLVSPTPVRASSCSTSFCRARGARSKFQWMVSHWASSCSGCGSRTAGRRIRRLPQLVDRSGGTLRGRRVATRRARAGWRPPAYACGRSRAPGAAAASPVLDLQRAHQLHDVGEPPFGPRVGLGAPPHWTVKVLPGRR